MKNRPIPAPHPEVWPHPGTLLREYVLPALNLSVSQASVELRITRQSLHRIMAGQAAITAETSLRLERFCGVPSRFWLRRQSDYESGRARDRMSDVLAAIPAYALPKTVLDQIGTTDAE
ncbi:HigA family addiction module antidote protein [Roseomonas aerophila]|uniref:HigA family addiction module antidote protein n=1 Tax=Teichococcus aerophilus TaxID=1224513 RepID=A0ABR7RIL6_9PROT|nr:HigA family addiction module antitoxin [Pseudoroseomonas aerophila]MBC9206154.1 HigA family addiction module antidote protein [Pseudoroseomonas aerophila]